MTDETDPRMTARHSYSGRLLTDSQFDKAWPVTEVIDRETRRSASFRETLTDFAHALSRGEPFDALRAEEILRDFYRIRFGETMNARRERLIANEAAVQDQAPEIGYEPAQRVLAGIGGPEGLRFYQSYDREAVRLAAAHDITETAAKGLMKTAVQLRDGRDLYALGKAIEAADPGLARARPDRSPGRASSSSSMI